VPLSTDFQTKRQENLIYLGKFNWHEFKHKYEKVDGKTISKTVTSYKKQYIFIDESNKSFRPVSSLDFLAKINSDIPVSNYADLMDIFQKDKHSSPPKELKKKEIKEIDFGPEDEYKHNIGSNFFKEISPDSFDKYSIYQEKKYNHTTSKYELLGFTISKSYNITFSNKKLSYQEMDYYNHTNRYSKYYSKEEIKNASLSRSERGHARSEAIGDDGRAAHGSAKPEPSSGDVDAGDGRPARAQGWHLSGWHLRAWRSCARGTRAARADRKVVGNGQGPRCDGERR